MVIPSGKGAGSPFKLDPFQKKFIRAVYEPHWFNTQRRVVRRAILSIARKNGKTALIAALVLAHLVGPEAIKNGEIYSAANDRAQAAQVFKFCKQIVDADEELSSLLTVVPSTKTISCFTNGSIYQAISSEAGTKHGLNPSMVVYDELAQSKNGDLFEALDTSFGAREEPILFIISTQSADPEHMLSKLIDDGIGADDPTIVCHLYAVDDDEPDIFIERIWHKANPALKTFRSIDDFRAMAGKAERMPSFEASFRNLYLNQRVSLVPSLISRPEWVSCIGDAQFEEGEEVILALDASGTTDLTGLVMMSTGEYDKVQAWAWKPKELIKEHKRRDRVPYDIWEKEGCLLTTEGRSINFESVAIKIAELSQKYKVLGLAYDRWRIDILIREMDDINLASQSGEGSGLRLEPWGQGFKDMAPAVDALENAVIERKLIHDNNPIFNWNMANAVVITDPAGNRKLDKNLARFRIDLAVALVMAKGLKARWVEQEKQTSYLDNNEMMVF